MTRSARSNAIRVLSLLLGGASAIVLVLSLTVKFYFIQAIAALVVVQAFDQSARVLLPTIRILVVLVQQHLVFLFVVD